MQPSGAVEASSPLAPAGDARQTYVCYRAGTPLSIDGRLDERAWSAAPRTAAFVDIEGSKRPQPRHATHARLLWDDTYLYIAAELDEPDLWATLTERDAVIFHDNDFEVFIDPDGDGALYYELEINALGTEWDLLLVKAYRDGGPALHGFDTPGLKSAVALDGTLNDPGDRDTGWTLEIAIPWDALAPFAGTEAPPHDGAVWWVNFSRVQWQLDPSEAGTGYTKRRRADGAPLAEDNWVWSPQGVISMHEPESWGLVQFSRAAALDVRTPAPFVAPADMAERTLLWRVYHEQRAFAREHGRYAATLAELGLEDPRVAELELSLTPTGYEAGIVCKRSSEGRAATRLWIDARGTLRR